jgi:NAD(P)-dependent dehydrogenase (short-subunit alcohol dehydrogenase family)
MNLATAVDTLLDLTIAPGYGNVGLYARRRLPGWPADPPRMDGKVVLVTGAASGLGLASAQGFARLGASVRVLGRSEDRAREAVERVRAEVPGADVRPVACDISSLAELERFTERFRAEEDRLDVLVNNAGVMPGERTRSQDGVELTFATHVLAPFVLIDRLAPLLEKSAPARVINVVSGGLYGQAIPVDDIESELASYGPKKFYARTKREELAITEAWAERLRGSGVVVHAMHPGWADTEGVRSWLPVFRVVTRPIIRDPDEGADTIVWLGAAEEPLRSSGGFWHDRRTRPVSHPLGANAHDERARAAVWRRCEERVAGHSEPRSPVP